MNSRNHEIINKAYTGFNERNIDAIFLVMHPDVRWPRAFEGDHVTGQEAVREYWTRQWGEINPKVEPLSIVECPDGKTVVEVDQMVNDLEGNLLYHGKVKHIYRIENGFIVNMDVEAE